MICDGAARSAKHRADPESPPPPRVSRGLKLRTGLRVYLGGHREVPADVFFDEPQSRPGVHVGFTSPRLWITSGLPTILEFASLITTSAFTRWDEKAGLQRDAIRSQCSTCSRHKKRRPAMKKISTVQVFGNEIWKEQKLTIGVDLGDRWSFYCVLDEAGKIILEQKVPTTPEAMKQTFGKIPRSLIALETGTHSPWVSRLLTELGQQVIVAHAQKVQLITKSNRKDDRHHARTPGTAGSHRSPAIGAGAPSQCKGANSSDGDPGASGTGECSNGVGERSTRVSEVLWRTTAQMRHVSGEPGAGRGIERGVAGCSAAVAERD